MSVGLNFTFRIIVHRTNAPRATPPTTLATMIPILVPPLMPLVDPDAAAALAVDEAVAVLMTTEAVFAFRPVEEAVTITFAAVSVTVD